MAEAKRRLQRVWDYHAPIVVSNCTEWYRHIWKRSWIRLPDPKLSRPWYWGVYQALASRMPGRQPAGYLAPWYQSSYANWGHHILTYEQAKTNLGLLPTNHAELLEPWFHLLFMAREKLQAFTRDYYHLNGTAYPHAISTIGTVTTSAINLNGTMMNISTTGESVKYCWDYYTHTGDVDFLREVGYPPLRDAAIFYHEYLLTDEQTGQKYIFPSRSQEFTNTIGLSNEYMTDSLIDLCMVRRTLDAAAKAADILRTDAELSAAWKADLAALRADYAVWPDGTWKTAVDTDDTTLDYGPPCVTDLAPICYTGEVDAWHGATPEMIEAARKTVKKYVRDNEIPWDRSFGMIARLPSAKCCSRARAACCAFSRRGMLRWAMRRFIRCAARARFWPARKQETARSPTPSSAALSGTSAVCTSRLKTPVCAIWKPAKRSISPLKTATSCSRPKRRMNTPWSVPAARWKALKCWLDFGSKSTPQTVWNNGLRGAWFNRPFFGQWINRMIRGARTAPTPINPTMTAASSNTSLVTLML